MQEKLEFIDLLNDCLEKEDFENLCFEDKEIEEYNDWQWDPFIVFEGDPDYMINPENWNTVYFIRIDNKVYYIDCFDDGEDLEKLRDFIEWQDPKISLWWYNTRSKTKHREYLEDNNWDWWDRCKNLKIAYRWWCGYVYTLFEYVE